LLASKPDDADRTRFRGGARSPTASTAAFAMWMFAHPARKTLGPGRSHIGDAIAYVRKGKRNNFDKP